ncbi:MAG: aminotransferase class III-fold pyridoxal phosphate-dependent enzyme [Candidatus Omnitrophica bacterium]|jgi:4-aminobutyrate aminotransferase-like enzyme|nr:aminotransferase class III-fold pyridoxal phosphate-dependent enzyme [Candidatus Omnitrophota bacterium]
MTKKKKVSSNSQSELLKLEEKYCSWGDTVHYSKQPKIFERARGPYLYDDKNVEYLDLQMWYSAANFGYGNERLNSVLKKQIDKLPQLACQYLHKEKIELATKLCQLNEKKFDAKGRVHFSVGGASAIEDSMKLIRNTTGKNLVFAFFGSYHGRTLEASSITSSYRYRRHFGHFANRAHFVPYPYCFRCFYGKGKDTCGLYCVRQFEKLFESEYYSIYDSKGDECEFTAFYIEAIQGTGGYIIPPKDYFKELKKILDRYKILLVDDEIQMGFYRTGKFWAVENFGITPDIMAFGKALTNGLNPLGGIWAKEKLISPGVFPPGSTHSTFSSNTLGTAVGLETLKIIEDSDFATSINQKGNYFVKQFKALQKKYPNIGDVDGIGLALRVEICEADGFTPSRALTDKICENGLSGKLSAQGKRRGLILDVGGYYKNVFTLAPSFYMSNREIDLALELFEEALIKALKA